MKLNRDVLITDIVNHQKSFYVLLDYIDNHDGSLEFPEQLYINLYNNDICNHEVDNNTQYHLSISSLLENGVFIHNDKNTGMITIERVIVDLLRFLDIKRAKELTHFDFEQLRKRTVDIVANIKSFDPSSPSYQDAMFSFNVLMSEIHSKIKENVNGLKAQVESIANEYKIYDTGSKDINVLDLYEKVTTLYNRYVLPCYEFINPDMEMVRTESFSKSVEGLINFYSDDYSQQYGTALTIQFRKTAITSYYKDIASLVRKLEHYSNHLEHDRSYFLAVESAFSNLIDNIIPLRHGKQRNKYLSPNTAFFTNFNVFNGLSQRKSTYQKRLNWNKELSSLRFKEYLTVIEKTPIEKKKNSLKHLPPEISISQERQIHISRLLYTLKMPLHIQDIHIFIYEYLKNELVNFELADVLYGLEIIIPIFDQDRVIPTFKKNLLTDDNYFLNYLVIKFEKELINV